MAKTIDNLGLEISSRYAQDREGYDEKLIKDAARIPQQTRITTTAPSHPSEFEVLFDLGKRGPSWAMFQAPANYYAQRRRLFAEQIIPEMGPPDLHDSQMQRIEATGQGDEEAKKEKEVILKLLNNLHTFDQFLIEINSRRAQYQKG